ncbi:MAG: molybdopterin guanine dinucleotide biosynthesis protein MoaE [Candidatus Bathyarchaeota archaeon BA1]|nr:MAG: molybdopterin guanine dinucleotide biosynthesis protein MoaE [Candidatus Bathyarchaeota archaeon BA1]
MVLHVINRAGVHKKGRLFLLDILKNTRDEPSFHKAGALALFIGVVRGETSSGEIVKKLELEAYEEKANEVLNSICEDLRERKGIIDVRIHHFIGEFDVGEDLVYVLVAGVHRHDVFPVLEEAVERYKREAPIFKKEHIIDRKGAIKSYWVSEHETG